MMDLRIEDRPAFMVAGRKVWISGQDNEQFGAFWDESHANGLVARLQGMARDSETSVTRCNTLGVSRVENDPDNRAFFFYIVAEISPERLPIDGDLETYTVPACKWAIFSNRGELPMSLVNAEMYAFMEWLPASEYVHAHAPELEVYPARNPALVEFWLPIEEARQ